jgi:hypothetical protein
MINFIIEASKNFVTHQMREKAEKSNIKIETKNDSIYTFIDVNYLGSSLQVHINYEKNVLSQITLLMLGEEDDSLESLTEMALETTNMLVGSAKVLAEESSQSCTISTPHKSDKTTFENINQNDFTQIIINNTLAFSILINEN